MSIVSFGGGAPTGSGSAIVANAPSEESGAGGVAVQKAGETIVADATKLNFASGATVTDGGNGIANVSIGAGTGTFQDLVLTPVAPFINGNGQIPLGYNNDLSDPSMPTYTRFIWRGADNNASLITGIDATDVPDGAIRIIQNMAVVGLDCGQIILVNENTPEALNSQPQNRIVGPGNYDFTIPPYGLCVLMRGENAAGDPRWLVVDTNGWVRKCIAQSLQIYPHLNIGSETPISGRLDNWNPLGDAEFGSPNLGIAGSNLKFPDHTALEINTDAAGAAITGLYNTYNTDSTDWGPIKILVNNGPGALTIRHEDANSSDQNQILCPGGLDIVLNQYESCIVWLPFYTGHINRWNVLAIAKADGLSPSFNATALPSVPAVTDDWNPGSPATRIRVLTNANGSALGGLVGAMGVDNPDTGRGETRVLTNLGPGPLVLISASPGSSAGNQFNIDASARLVIRPTHSVTLFKDEGNDWLVFPQSDALQSITPTALPGSSVNDWAPVDNFTGFPLNMGARWIRMTASGGTILTGIDGTGFITGERLLLTNYGSGMTIDNQSSSSLVANRITTPGGGSPGDFVLGTFCSVWLIREAGGGWTLEGYVPGG